MRPTQERGTNMLKREFYEAVANGITNDEVKTAAREALEQLNHSNELRRAAAAKKAVEKEAERAPIRQAIVNVLTKDPKTASMLIEEAGVEIKPQAIPSLLKGMVEDGTVAKTKVKIKGKGEQVGYILA